MAWTPYLLKSINVLFISTFILISNANGIIFYEYREFLSDGEDQNQSIPDDERANIFNAVARVCDENGQNTSGSATYLRGKYLLTANHVGNKSHVTFDGNTFYERDVQFVPRQIIVEGENVDLKLIKLVKVPEFPKAEIEIKMNTNPFSELINDREVTLVGWGVGRAPNSDPDESLTNIWTWGDQSTLAKRWGLNNIETSILFNSNDGVYNYKALVTNLFPQVDSNKTEAGLARFDSGSGMFAKIDNEWQLVGIATAVTNYSGPDTSTFSFFQDNPAISEDDDDPFADLNFFVHISSYVSKIEEAIPSLSTYSGWKIDHSLYGTDAINSADTDGDGINQLLEFALGGDPNKNDISILPDYQLVEDNNETYLEITLTRPKDLQGIRYTPQITKDLLSSWTDVNESEFKNDFTSNSFINDIGTETVNYRLKLTTAEKAFLRILISESS